MAKGGSLKKTSQKVKHAGAELGQAGCQVEIKNSFYVI